MVAAQNKEIDEDGLRFRAMYMNPKLDLQKGVFDGCTAEEIVELQKRRSLEDWVLDSKQLKLEMMYYLKYALKEDTRLIDMILRI
jgi:hypothetical protein